MKTRVQNNSTNGEYSLYGTATDQRSPLGSLLRAKVIDNNDPLSLGRVKVEIPSVHGIGYDQDSLPWAAVMQSGSGAGSGSTIIPMVGTTVLVSFEAGDINKPIVVGSVPGTTSVTTLQVQATVPSQYGKGSSTTAKIRQVGVSELPIEGQDINKQVVFKSHNDSIIYMDNTTSDNNIVLRGASDENLTLADQKIKLETSIGSHLLMNDFPRDYDEEHGEEVELYSKSKYRLFFDSQEDGMMALEMKGGDQGLYGYGGEDGLLYLENKNAKVTLGDEILTLYHKGSDTMLDVSPKYIDATSGSASIRIENGEIKINAGGATIKIIDGVVSIGANVVNIDAPVINLGDD